MVLLHDHLGALLDLGQDGVDIAGELGFRDAERPHSFDHSVYHSSLSGSASASSATSDPAASWQPLAHREPAFGG
jgi:hypothetical protein